MGNLIKDFWTYTYKEKQYFGIVEVIKGEDLAQNRNTKKYETHIEKALEYTMQHDVVSHMSIQTYCTWLKERDAREYNEQKYYPFVLEFESKKNYNEAVCEAAVYVNYLISDMGIHRDDILIMVNNSRSLYVYVNPKIYCLKPHKELNKVYLEMFKYINNELGFQYVDKSIVASTYKIMKTPNCYYEGGYFVHVSLEELMQLLVGTKTKSELTRKRRSLNKEIPGQLSLRFISLYNQALKKVENKNKTKIDKDEEFPGCCGCCVKYLLKHMIEQGHRNFGLVSVGIYLRGLGYTKQEVIENLKEIARSWNHDENDRSIESKVNTIFRRNYKFSCTYAKEVYADLGIENLCKNCPYGNRNKVVSNIEVFNIDAEIINDLWDKGASTRHYIMYIELVSKELLNKSFNIEDQGLNKRTLRELFRYSSRLNKSSSGDGNIYITYNASKKIYVLPNDFTEQSINDLGEYIKHYLKMLVKGYKALKDKILIHISRERLMNELGYSGISGLLKFLKKLKDIGLLKEHKNNVIALYYNTYKVIGIQDIQDADDAENQPKEQDIQEIQKELNLYDAVIGEQLSMGIIKPIIPVFRIRSRNKKMKKDRESPG